MARDRLLCCSVSRRDVSPRESSARRVPLTAERLAAELQLDGETFRRYVDPSYRPEDPAFEPALQAIRIANTQAVASVLEHALTKGSGVNMHMLYLKQYAGYTDRAAADPVTEVRFCGENDLPE